MEKRLQLWTAIQELMQGFGPFYQEAVAPVMSEFPRHWNLLRAAAGLEPQPLTLQQAQQFAPYLPQAAVAIALEALQSNGMLQTDAMPQTAVLPQTEGGHYYLTEDGAACVRSFYETAQRALADVAPLPEEQLVWLRDALRQLVEAAATLPEPQNKIGLVGSRWSAPQEDGPLAPQIDQYVTDLYFFRDDAHVAAWERTGLSGPAWEALTFIWRDQAHTAQELAEQLQYRTLSEADWAVVLEGLAGRNLIEAMDGGYQLTSEGRKMREDAEALTDELYYAAFAGLDSEELERLLSYMEQARDNLATLLIQQQESLQRSHVPEPPLVV